MDFSGVPGGDEDEQGLQRGQSVFHHPMPKEEVKPGSPPGNSPILMGYFKGQMFSSATFSIWWCMSSPVWIALMGQQGIGKVRLVYNLAICVANPFSSLYGQQTSIRWNLIWTAMARATVYGILFPALWICLQSGWWGLPSVGNSVGFQAGVLTLMGLDGLIVTLLNFISIDTAGIDICADQYKCGNVTQDMRNMFLSYHQIVMDGAIVVFAPLVAYVTLKVGRKYGSSDGEDDGNNDVDTFVMLIALGGSFLFFFSASVLYYLKTIPPMPTSHDAAPRESGLCDDEGLHEPLGGVPNEKQEEAAKEEAESSCQLIQQGWSTTWAGLEVVWKRKQIFWRMIFFALEMAVEDTMMGLVFAIYGTSVMYPNDQLRGNLWTGILAASSKVGGVLAASWMNKYWKDTGKYGSMFVLCAVGGCTALLMPLAMKLHEDGTITSFERDACVFGSGFLFFTLTTPPKIGFQNLLQNMIAEEEAGQVFGFVGTFIVSTDALMIFVLSQFFQEGNEIRGMWIATAFFAAVGIIEGVFGPCLFIGDTLPAEEGTVKADEPAAGVEHDALCYNQISDEPDAATAPGGGPTK